MPSVKHFFIGDRLLYFIHREKLVASTKQEDRLSILRIKYSVTFAYLCLFLAYVCFLVAFFGNEWFFMSGYQKTEGNLFRRIYQIHISFLTAQKYLLIRSNYENLTDTILQDFMLEHRIPCINNDTKDENMYREAIVRYWSVGRSMSVFGLTCLSWGVSSILLSNIASPKIEKKIGKLTKDHRQKKIPGFRTADRRGPNVRSAGKDAKKTEVDMHFMLRLGISTCIASFCFIISLMLYLEMYLTTTVFLRKYGDMRAGKLCTDYQGMGYFTMLIGIFLSLLAFMFMIDAYDPA